MSWSWPTLELTEHEKKFCSLYPGERGLAPVEEKTYPGSLELTEIDRHPIFPFQTAQRCKIRSITFSGDIAHFMLQAQSAVGTNYFGLNGIRIAHLIPGWNGAQQQGGFPPPIVPPTVGIGPLVVPSYTTPYVFRPYPLLLSSNTLTFTGHETEPFQTDDDDPPIPVNYRIDFCLDVVEFPGMEDEGY